MNLLKKPVQQYATFDIVEGSIGEKKEIVVCKLQRNPKFSLEDAQHVINMLKNLKLFLPKSPNFTLQKENTLTGKVIPKYFSFEYCIVGDQIFLTSGNKHQLFDSSIDIKAGTQDKIKNFVR